MVCEAVARREHPDFLAEGLPMCHKQAWLTRRSAIRANGDRAHFFMRCLTVLYLLLVILHRVIATIFFKFFSLTCTIH
jgi:hypothetical protein